MDILTVYFKKIYYNSEELKKNYIIDKLSYKYIYNDNIYKNYSEDMEILRKYIQNNIFFDINFTFWNNIFSKTIKDYDQDEFNIDEYGFEIFPNENTNYHFFNDFFLNKLLEELINYYKKKLIDDINLWFNNKISNFENDNTFGEKLKISDDSKVLIIGDTHSSPHHLWEILTINKDIFENDKLILKKNRYIIFLGDMVDYGPYGLEVLWLILTLKKYNLNNVYIINGNHEDYSLYSKYINDDYKKLNFLNEMEKQINIDSVKKIKTLLYMLPSLILLSFEGDDYYYQLNHGAIVTEREKLINFINSDKIFCDFDNIVNRDIKWGDFKIYGDYVDFRESTSGRTAYTPKYIKKYLEETKIKTIITGHQDTVNFSYFPNIELTEINNENWLSKYIDITHREINIIEGLSIKYNPYKKMLCTPLISEIYNINIIDGVHGIQFKTDDINACTLSNATISKKLPFINYSFLEKKKNKYNILLEGNINTPIIESVFNKYLKYKLKYLKLKKLNFYSFK